MQSKKVNAKKIGLTPFLTPFLKKLLFVVLVASIFILSGCSAIMRSTHYEIVPTKKLNRASISDWVEDLTEPTFGVFRPPLYASKHAENYYVFYPIVVEEKGITVGPAFLPIIPFCLFPKSPSVTQRRQKFFIRCWNETQSTMPFPEKIFLIDGDRRFPIRRIRQESNEGLGILYEYQLGDLITNLTTFAISVVLSDEYQISVRYSLRNDTWFAPFFSFNEPSKDLFVRIVE